MSGKKASNKKKSEAIRFTQKELEKFEDLYQEGWNVKTDPEWKRFSLYVQTYKNDTHKVAEKPKRNRSELVSEDEDNDGSDKEEDDDSDQDDEHLKEIDLFDVDFEEEEEEEMFSKRGKEKTTTNSLISKCVTKVNKLTKKVQKLEANSKSVSLLT